MLGADVAIQFPGIFELLPAHRAAIPSGGAHPSLIENRSLYHLASLASHFRTAVMAITPGEPRRYMSEARSSAGTFPGRASRPTRQSVGGKGPSMTQVTHLCDLGHICFSQFGTK